MHVFICKIKEFLRKNTKNILIIGGIIILCLFIGFMLGNRKNVSSNRNTIDAIRNELSNAQDAKSDIAGTTSDIANTSSDIANTSSDIAETVGNLANSINNVTDTSKQFDSIVGACQNIIEQIRKQGE